MTAQMNISGNAFYLLAEEYDQWYESPEGRALFAEELDAIRLLMAGLEHPFLEIGLGTGRFAEALGIEYGIDPSPSMLEKARRRGISVKQGRGEKLPYDDEYFGAVFVLFALCFVEDPEQVIGEAYRVLKDDGRLIIGIINRESPWGRSALKKREGGHPFYLHARLYSTPELGEMIERAGMAVEGYASALLHPPLSGAVGPAAGYGIKKEPVRDAGFICIRSRKS